MKVAYVSFAPFISGAERSLQIMLQWAPKTGIDPIVVCPPGSKMIPWCETHHVRYFAVPLPDRDKWHPVRWFSSVIRLARLLRRERVDIVHSNQVWSFAAISAAASLVGIPRVCHMRDEVSPAATRWWCKSGVEAVICISAHVEQLVAPAWQRDRHPPLLRTAINPVVPPAEAIDGSASADRCRRVRHFFQVPDDAVLFGFIGQIVSVKGVRELLKAASALPRSRRWHLLIAGRDPHPGQPYEAECRRDVERLGLVGRVSFAGYLERVSDFYEAIDATVVPSLQEPLGRIPLEAATFGKPSIAFATGGLPETIVHGVTGWLVPTGNVDGLRHALASVLDDTEAAGRAGAHAREHVLQHCAPDRYMGELADLYRTLLESRKHPHAVAATVASRDGSHA